MRKPRLFGDLAKYYDYLYSCVDYVAEAQSVINLIDKHQRSNGRDLLEIACGTGKIAALLKTKFSVVATDISEEMLGIARKQVSGVTFRRANMLTLDLKKSFDVVLCLGSSIGCVKTHSELEKTLANFSRHLKPGGVLLIEPWFSKKAFQVGSPHLSTYTDSNICIACSNVSMVKGRVSILEFHFLIAERDGGVQYCRDRHELGMFEVDEVLSIFEGLGLRARYLKKWLNRGRGLYIASKL